MLEMMNSNKMNSHAWLESVHWLHFDYKCDYINSIVVAFDYITEWHDHDYA